jgi:hypothetical protein
VERSPDAIADELRRFAASRGLGELTVTPMAPTIEDVFMARMGAAEQAEAPASRGAG